MMVGMVLHFVYGTVAGGVFAALALGLGFVALSSVGLAIGWGIVWAAVLLVVMMVFWMRLVLDQEPGEPSEMVAPAAAHLAYGIVLGAWLFYDVVGLG